MHVTDPRDSDAVLYDWLRLAQASGIGPVAVRALLERFGTPAAILGAGFAALRGVVSEAQARSLLAPAPSPA